jgi:ATP-dependent Lon protease
MPPEAESQARKEVRRYERMPEAAAEAGMVRSYLDWLIGLPWSLPEEKPIDIAEAKRILDEDHYGLDKIKSRIIEYPAVRKLAPQGKAPILRFVGPPGVGKTSLGQSIARAMARPLVRVSLGGVYDKAEIRGHRRTYIGALPGNIIQAIKKAGARNCVMMLDEIDKMGRGIQGDPSAAMLEVLDPEQNSTFRDNYLGVPFDLSRVVFVATANMLDTVPGPLQDRMEVISLPGHTEDEKLEIARRYLIRRQLEVNGLKAEQADIDSAALRLIIRGIPARPVFVILNGKSARLSATWLFRLRKAARPRCFLPRRISQPSLGNSGSKTKSPCGPAFQESLPDWPGRRSAAIFSSLKQPVRREKDR